jgi:hypothetical protein
MKRNSSENSSGSFKKLKPDFDKSNSSAKKVNKSLIGKPLRVVLKESESWETHVEFLLEENQKIFRKYGTLTRGDIEYAFDAVLDNYQKGDWIIKAGTYDDETCEYDTENPYDGIIDFEDCTNPEIDDLMIEIQEEEDSLIFDKALKKRFFERTGKPMVKLPRCRSSFIIGL